MTKEGLEKKIKKWEQEKELLLKSQQLKQEKREIKNKGKEERRKIATTKLLTFFLFINCTIIEIFTLYVTIKQMNMGLGIDFTPLQMLITSVVGEVIVFAVYSLKSLKENTKGGIVYQAALTQHEFDNQDQEALG